MSSKLFGTLGCIFEFYAGLDNINDYHYSYKRNVFEKTGDKFTITQKNNIFDVFSRLEKFIKSFSYIFINI
jgi:flagellar biosynthesis chaperone FliJ